MYVYIQPVSAFILCRWAYRKLLVQQIISAYQLRSFPQLFRKAASIKASGLWKRLRHRLLVYKTTPPLSFSLSLSLSVCLSLYHFVFLYLQMHGDSTIGKEGDGRCGMRWGAQIHLHLITTHGGSMWLLCGWLQQWQWNMSGLNPMISALESPQQNVPRT